MDREMATARQTGGGKALVEPCERRPDCPGALAVSLGVRDGRRDRPWFLGRAQEADGRVKEGGAARKQRTGTIKLRATPTTRPRSEEQPEGDTLDIRFRGGHVTRAFDEWRLEQRYLLAFLNLELRFAEEGYERLRDRIMSQSWDGEGPEGRQRPRASERHDRRKRRARQAKESGLPIDPAASEAHDDPGRRQRTRHQSKVAKGPACAISRA